MVEIYKDIPNYEGYQVSNLGNVKSLDRVIKHKDSYSRSIKGRVLKAGLSSVGYLGVTLCKNGKKKTKQIHQLVAIAFLNHTPNGYKLIVDHKNAIKTDNKLSNLQLISQRLNSSKDQKNGSSSYIGVCWDKHTNKWRSLITINGKTKHLGLFTNELEASKCYQKALKELSE